VFCLLTHIISFYLCLCLYLLGLVIVSVLLCPCLCCRWAMYLCFSLGLAPVLFVVFGHLSLSSSLGIVFVFVVRCLCICCLLSLLSLSLFSSLSTCFYCCIYVCVCCLCLWIRPCICCLCLWSLSRSASSSWRQNFNIFRSLPFALILSTLPRPLSCILTPILSSILNFTFWTMDFKWEYELQEMQARYRKGLHHQP
jgi:hypothetical protein